MFRNLTRKVGAIRRPASGVDATRTIENPVTGERIEFRERTDDRLRFEYYLAPGGFAVGRVDHVHPRQREWFEVRSGRLGVRIDGNEWTATPGTRFGVPPETPHTVWNEGDEEVHATVEIRPGLDIASFFETTYGLARDGEVNRWGLPGPLQLSVLLDEFGDEISLAGIPRPVQTALARLLAPVGRRAGSKARYPRYAVGVSSSPEDGPSQPRRR